MGYFKQEFVADECSAQTGTINELIGNMLAQQHQFKSVAGSVKEIEEGFLRVWSRNVPLGGTAPRRREIILPRWR
jgi:hypothetical protein